MQIRDEKVTRKIYITCDGHKFLDEEQAIQHENELKKELNQCKDYLVLVNSKINMLKDDTLPKEFAKYMKLKKMSAKEYRKEHYIKFGHERFNGLDISMSYRTAKYSKSESEYEAYRILKSSQRMLKDYKREFYATKKRIDVLKSLLEKPNDNDSDKEESK